MSSYKELFQTFFKIGCLSFGGPAAQLAMMQKTIVDDKKWLDERTYLNALSFCMLLPGPEAQQVATYVGYRLHGIKGALTSGLLFILPGFFLILGLSWLYVAYGKVPFLMGLFYGLKACVLIIVIEALLRLKKRALKNEKQLYIAIIAFIALFFFNISYPLIVCIAAITGMFILKDDAVSPLITTVETPFSQKAMRLLIGLAIWLLPLVALFYFNQSFYADVGAFFAKLAVVTFGGAYAILALVAEEAVKVKQWLSLSQMIDGLALAETTPGPLILVLSFVGFVAGFNATGLMSTAFIAASVATIMTFAPSFIFIIVGGDYIEKINSNPRLKGALSGIMAAAVGVIAFLSVWFALHVVFTDVKPFEWGVVKTTLPNFFSLDFYSLGLSLLAAYLLLKRHMNLLVVMGICAALGILKLFLIAT